MKGISKYKILNEQKLIVIFSQGNVDFEDIKLCREKVIRDKDFDPSYNLLLDLRRSKLNNTIDDMKGFGFFIYNNRELKEQSLKIILTNTPEHVVYTTFLINSLRNHKDNYEIFSSLPESLVHLRVNREDFNLVEGEIEQLIED